jgi:hypothetical protein
LSQKSKAENHLEFGTLISEYEEGIFNLRKKEKPEPISEDGRFQLASFQPFTAARLEKVEF